MHYCHTHSGEYGHYCHSQWFGKNRFPQNTTSPLSKTIIIFKFLNMNTILRSIKSWWLENATTIVVVQVILILWLLSWIFVKVYYDNDWTVSGQWGDSFGAINALFSGLTIVGLVYTIILQRHQIGLQQQEAKDANDRHKKEDANIERERFEAIFFDLLTLHHSIFSSLTVKSFNLLLQKIRNQLPNNKAFDDSQFATFKKCYFECTRDYEPDLSSYLQSIASIYSEIESSDLGDDEKKVFLKRFWNYLSQPERQALYYLLMLTEDQDPTIVELLEMEAKHNLLRSMPDKSFIHPTHRRISWHLKQFAGQQ